VDVGRRNLLVCCLSNFVAATGMAGFLPAFPIILRRLDMTDEASIGLWTGLLTAAAPFSAALSGPLWGALGDRVGRKVMVLRALIGLAVFVGCMSFFADPWILLGFRISQGIFSGFVAPSLTLVSVHTAPQHQGKVAALLQAALLAGSVLGPPIGGRLLDHYSTSVLFSSAAAGALLAATLVAIFAREEVRPAPSAHASSVSGAFENAIADVRITLREPAVLRLLIALFAVRFGTMSVEPLFAIYVKSFETHSSFVEKNLGFVNGALVSATPLGNLLALPAWGRAVDRSYRRAFILAASGAALLYAPQALAPGIGSLFAIRFLAGIFLAGVIPAAYGLVADETPVERRGSSYSLTFSAIALASSVAPVTGGTLVSHGIPIRWLFLGSAIPMLFGALWLWRRPSAAPAKAA
jgi:DHA1 family multidrug resistance protein-like MFS transporter